MFFKKESWAKIKKAGKDFCNGETLIPGKKKGAKFWFSWTDNSSYLRIKGEDKRILDTLTQTIGKPYVKWTVRDWFSTCTMYAWEKQQKKVKTLYNSLCFAEAMKSGIFKFLGLGHRNIQLLQS